MPTNPMNYEYTKGQTKTFEVQGLGLITQAARVVLVLVFMLNQSLTVVFGVVLLRSV